MEEEPIDLINGDFGLFESLGDDGGDFAGGEGVDFASVHGHEVVGSVVDYGSFSGGGDGLGFSSVSDVERMGMVLWVWMWMV